MSTNMSPSVIDSHVHFFNADRSEGIVWPLADSPIRAAGNATPARRQAIVAGYSLTGAIAVETSRRAIDDEWILAMADAEDLVLGAVLNLQPDLGDFDTRLESACSSASFLGVRLRPIKDYDLGANNLLRNLRSLERREKTIEFGAPDARHKAAFSEMAGNLPDTTLILDHAGHPNLDSHADEKWLRSMREIAACPNVFAKITMIGDRLLQWRPTLDTLVSIFGPGRLLYGSNWPVDEVTGISELENYFGSDADAFFQDNARIAYGV